MKKRINGWLPIISASSLLLFWLLFAAYLPMNQPYVNWVLDHDWTWINMIGLWGSSIGVLAIFTIYDHIKLKGNLEKMGLVSAALGAILLSSVLFFECFILKGIAIVDQSLIDLNGSFYNYSPFKYATLTGGLIFSSGMFLLCQALLREKAFEKLSLFMIMIGSPLFSIMYIPGNLRLLGVFIYCIGLISIGVKMLKYRDGYIDIEMTNTTNIE